MKIKYDVLVDVSPEGLIEQVQEKLDEGWKPLGGVSQRELREANERTGDDYSWAQAIIREASK